MKIRELLREADEQDKKDVSKLPKAASIDDPEDDEEDGEVGNASAEFKKSAIAIGRGVYALSAWAYPAAWSGGGYSDMRMNTIAALADEMNVQLGDYEHLSDHDMTDDRRLEVVFFNEQTDTMFRLHASGANGTVEFYPSLTDLQRTGGVTNAQMPKIKNIETTVKAWVDAVPEDWADEPRDRRWNAAERKVTNLFDFGGDDVGDDEDDPSFSDPNHPNSRIGIDPYQDNDPDATQRFMDELIAKAMAEKAAKLAGDQGPGRDKR